MNDDEPVTKRHGIWFWCGGWCGITLLTFVLYVASMGPADFVLEKIGRPYWALKWWEVVYVKPLNWTRGITPEPLRKGIFEYRNWWVGLARRNSTPI